MGTYISLDKDSKKVHRKIDNIFVQDMRTLDNFMSPLMLFY